MCYINYKRIDKAYTGTGKQNMLETLYAGGVIEEPQPTDKRTYTLIETEEHPFTVKTKYRENTSLYHTIKNAHTEMLNLVTKENSLPYTTFQIPKHTGGMRIIQAPDTYLKKAHQDVLDALYKEHILVHEAAQAFVPEHGTLTALQKHQANKSRWFLKLDIRNFFPSLNYRFVLTQLKKNFILKNIDVPSNELENPLKLLLQAVCTASADKTDEQAKALIKSTLVNEVPAGEECKEDIAAIQNSLVIPQGSPLSPMLANLAMVMIDEHITQALRKKGPYCYTRYADDILISCPMHFNKADIIQIVLNAFAKERAPFTLKHNKTRYGSNAGRNWNLGLMYNKDNNITLGHKANQQNKAMINNFLNDFKQDVKWDKEKTQRMLGLISYSKYINNSYTAFVVKRLERKHNLNFMDCVKTILN